MSMLCGIAVDAACIFLYTHTTHKHTAVVGDVGAVVRRERAEQEEDQASDELRGVWLADQASDERIHEQTAELRGNSEELLSRDREREREKDKDKDRERDKETAFAVKYSRLACLSRSCPCLLSLFTPP